MIGGRIKRILPLCGGRPRLLPHLRRRRRRRRHRRRPSRCTNARGASPRSPRRSRPAGSARWKSTGPASLASGKNRSATGGWINGGFFVLDPKVGDYIDGDGRCGSASRWSGSRARASCRSTFHDGFWQPMDTLRDKRHLEELWGSSAESAMEDLVRVHADFDHRQHGLRRPTWCCVIFARRSRRPISSATTAGLFRPLPDDDRRIPEIFSTRSTSATSATSRRRSTGFDAVVHLAAVSNDPMGNRFERSPTRSIIAPACARRGRR